MKRCTTILALLLLLAVPWTASQAQTGWGVRSYEGFKADSTGNGTLNLGWSTGNLGNTWNEGEWVPYLLTLKNVNINNPNFSDIVICYDFTRGNLDARFIDLVRGVQIGTTALGNADGWPDDSAGSALPLTSRSLLEAAQNYNGLTPFGTEYHWAGYRLIHLDSTQMNRAQGGGLGAVDEATRCFTITKQDIINAYGGINNVPNTSTFYIYFNLHEAQTFIWNNALQAQLDSPPTDEWGGYLYGNLPFSADIRLGSGFVSGSSGHTYLPTGNKTVPIPIPPQPAGQLSGLKWHDVNGNNVQDGSESILDGWPVYISTIIGGIPISDTVITDVNGAWTIGGLPQGSYVVSEELAGGPTTGSASGYALVAPAFAQTPPSEWEETYPDLNSTGVNINGTATTPGGILAGFGPVSWDVTLSTNVGNINFGNYIPAPVCAVFPADTTICDESQVTLTAQRIAQGTPPYQYLWSGPNNFVATTQSIVVPASAAGTYTVVLTDANGLVSSGCSGTVSVFPIPVFEISGDTLVCESSAAHGYAASFAVNSPVPADSIIAWQWTISGNGSIVSGATTDSVTVDAGTTGSYTLTLTVTDVYGCTETVSRTVAVQANPTCSITPTGDVCPGSTGNIFSGPAGAFTYSWGISGNGSIAGSTTGQSVSVNAGVAVGSFTLTLTITETAFPFCSSTCTLVVNVRDIQPPVITCTADSTVECPAPNPLPFTTPTAVDNCDPNPSIVITSTVVTQGQCANEYSVTRTWTATDIYGNADSCSQTVHVIDTTPPVIDSAAVNESIECDGTGIASQIAAWLADNGHADASDACGSYTWSNNFDANAFVPACGGSGYVDVTFYATDACSNVDSTTARFTIVDTTPPTITPAADDTVSCGQQIIFTDPIFSDACDVNASLSVVKDTVIYNGGGAIDHIRSWIASDGCQNVSDTVSQTITELCNEFGSLTQGFYGNAGGAFCGTGQGTEALIDSLLMLSGDTIIVGTPGSGSLTMVTGDADCVIGYLPGGGTATALTQDYSFDQTTCAISPNGMPLNSQGRFSNILLSQTITLALNLRLDTTLATNFYLPSPSTPWMRTEGADYVNGICLDGDDIPDSTFQNFYFPPSVLSALGSNGSNKTPLDLLTMANQALGGTTFSGVTLSDIVSAINAINVGFDEGRFFVGYYVTPPPKSVAEDLQPNGFVLHQNHPNPFNPVTTITYTLPERSTVYLAVYNSLGEEVAVLVNDEMPAGTHAVVWNSADLRGSVSSGVFTYRILAKGDDGTLFHDFRKMLLVK